ncbi:MAG: class I SAM-dependent methyltransferase [Actinobacteria bacterium]|nr:class I SAM-dependent methyltransferase [Actinomycetota bacterium]
MDYKKIYENTFNLDWYSVEHHIQYDYIINAVKNLNLDNNNIIDIGSGRGHLLKQLLENNIHNLEITSVDLKKFHNHNNIKFIECDLSKSSDRNKLLENEYDILICSDVFEHLDKSFIEDVIIMCSKLSKTCIFSIANHSDIINGVELHTIQEKDSWWENIITKYFQINKKDIYYNGILYMYICTSIN